MTDYLAITEAETNPKAPATSSLWKRWTKNWIAGFEGAAGAPRLKYGAIDAWFSTAGEVGSLAFLVTTAGSVGVVTAGTVYAGSSLAYSGFHKSGGLSSTGAALTGSWRALGSILNSGVDQRATLFIRIA